MEFTPILTALSSFFKSSELIKKNSLPFTVLILSPHPDDECISGAIALRLALENKAKIINVAVTLGSNKDRQKERLNELKNACIFLNMDLNILSESWSSKEREVKNLIKKYGPDLIIVPHVKDHHPTHVKTGELLLKALKRLKHIQTIVAWSEFWGENKKVNVMIEVPQNILELQMKGLQKHKGEISRNPYHLRLPAWMMDNVRRGSEILSGKGAKSPDIAFGVLYQLQKFSNGKLVNIKLKDLLLKSEDDLGQIFKLILDAAAGSKTRVK